MSEQSDKQCYCEWDSDYCETNYCDFCNPRVYHPYCDGRVQYVGSVGICFTCRRYSQPLKLCYCVKTINPNIRTHSGKTLIQHETHETHETYHDFPGDFPRCLDPDICPNEHYIICASMHKQDCLGVHTRGYMCKGCIPNNKCTAEGCTRLLFKYEKDQSRIEHNLCPLHYVFTCVTCAQMRIAGDTVDDDISHPRTQCIDCDKTTNTIICVKCMRIHMPHTLTYPCETVTTPICMECGALGDNNGTYWNLIQTPIINALYKTVMWRFRAFNHNTLNVCVLMHLTWHEGDIEVMLQDTQACATYLKSQRCNAATALVRLRLLPQELRLMILGYL